MSDDKTMAATFGQMLKASIGIGEMPGVMHHQGQGGTFRLPMQTAALVAGGEAGGRELVDTALDVARGRLPRLPGHGADQAHADDANSRQGRCRGGAPDHEHASRKNDGGAWTRYGLSDYSGSGHGRPVPVHGRHDRHHGGRRGWRGNH